MGQVGYLLVEVLVEDGDRLHHLTHVGADALADELLDLGANVGPVDVGVVPQEMGTDVGSDHSEPGQPVDVGQPPWVGQPLDGFFARAAVQYLRVPVFPRRSSHHLCDHCRSCPGIHPIPVPGIHPN